jgi:hypothetical protein
MVARFNVNSTKAIDEKNTFILTGNVVDGFVKPGMRVQFRSKSESASVPIHSVDNVKTSRGSEIALTLLCENGDFVERLRSFAVRGQILDVVEGSDRK